MRPTTIPFLLAAAACCVANSEPSAPAPSGAIASAIADTSRPATDVARDRDRRPAATLAYLALRPGMAVADYASGGGYFTRLFSSVVGTGGHVYASVPTSLLRFPNVVSGLAATEGYARSHPNVSINVGAALDVARYPRKLDLFWIAQNYHDLHDDFMGPVDIASFNRAVFDSLKPGGEYVVLDHVARAGSPTNVTDTLHRIESSVVRREVEAAGFQYVGESRILANPEDPDTASVFDPSIQGRTDQFILRFRRPR